MSELLFILITILALFVIICLFIWSQDEADMQTHMDIAEIHRKAEITRKLITQKHVYWLKEVYRL